MSNLSLARHDYELEPDSMNHVYLDHKHMGLGGDDSWSPSVHEVRTTPHHDGTVAVRSVNMFMRCVCSATRQTWLHVCWWRLSRAGNISFWDIV